MPSLPLKHHPIYHFRKALIIIGAISLGLCLLSPSAYYGGGPDEPWSYCAIILFLSILFCIADLVAYAQKKTEHPDHDPEWPQKKWMVVDFLLFLLLQAGWWIVIAFILNTVDYGYQAPALIAGAYGALGVLICSILHAYCFWKELTAFYKNKWLANLTPTPCARCGYAEFQTPAAQEPVVQGPPNGIRTELPPNTFHYAGPSAAPGPSCTNTPYQAAPPSNILTPESPDSAMEEGLLIGSDYGGYGSISASTPEPTIAQPVEVVVGSTKGKKKVNARKEARKSMQPLPQDRWVGGVRAAERILNAL